MENTKVFLKFGLVSFNFIRLWCSLKFFYSSEEKVTLASDKMGKQCSPGLIFQLIVCLLHLIRQLPLSLGQFHRL